MNADLAPVGFGAELALVGFGADLLRGGQSDWMGPRLLGQHPVLRLPPDPHLLVPSS